LLLALVVSVRGLGAQETIQIDSLGRKPAAKPDDGGFRWTPLLAPGYNPEMGLLIAGGFLFSAKLGRKDSTLQRSTLSSTVSISTTGAINVSGVLTSFFLQNRLRVLVNVGYKTMPDSYWGVGYDAGLEPTSQDSTTKYHRAWWQVNPRAYWGVRKHLYVGGGVDLNRTIATEVNPTMAADPYYLRYGHDNFNSGLTAAIFYDSRDVAVNAWRGLYLSLTGTFYGSYLGSNNTYQIYLLDYRQYRTLGRPGRTLAWQVKSRLGAKNVPWAELSPLGTGYDLRGYREGRFRDETTLLALVEFRQMFTRSGGRLSRHGFVAWAGGGTLGSSFKDLNGFLPNGGIGYRFELQPRSNVRVDVGFGKKSNGVYFNFTEAF
jgi:outer membrane protein assembly factor BamA